ncbi:MAG: CBS domain-containing protein [Phycisphaeraceae bacterium]
MGLREDILNDPVSALELRELAAVKRTTTVRDAIGLMRENRVGCVVVLDDQGRPLGKFTERLLIKLLLEDPDHLDHPVEQHMASAWAFVHKTDPIATVIDRMQSKGLRFVVVLDEDGRAVAMTGQKGVMQYIADHFPRQVKVQRMRSKISMDQREGA